ncbi:MAG: TonB-dependent receptor [Erythrobacter sp.]|nr:TonB-dependent receptor [Erythrobacter sp.]MDZ4273724.1 TonB-dependent receptor [Erythrobacter sp.]
MQFAPVAPSRRIFALGTASCLALSAALASPAIAQDASAEEPPAEDIAAAEPVAGEIIVSGFRAALQSAQNIKRNADTFVDVITAEDIGALPDRSVAEALQRVPGVNIGRFEKSSDPTRFSVEGTGVIIRGLPFVSSQLNGRDIFSANGGRSLSFEDVSPELVGRVEVFKNITADQIEGHIAGLVNLVTRKPLDNRGLHVAGSIEGNYGDLRQEWSPTFNILASNTFETGQGTFGVQLSYSNSKLRSRTDASQLVDYCYRPADLSGGCARIFDLNSGGFGDEPNFTPGQFPPAGSVVVPQFANVRSTTLDRDREAFSAIGQFETLDGDLVMTLEFLRSETSFETEEFALLGRIDDGVSTNQPRPGTTYEFDADGNFQRGVLTQNVGNAFATPFGLGGIPMDALRFVRDTDSTTQDISFDAVMNFSDRFRGKVEMQHVRSTLRRDSVFGATSTWADIAIDVTGSTPDIQFLAPVGAPADYFTSGFFTYYWFGLDSREKNEGELFSLSGDLEYDVSDEGFFRKVTFGARWAARDRANRNTNFSTWGNLSAPWAGRAGCAPWNDGPGCAATGGFQPGRFFTGLPGQEFAIAGGAFVDEFPNASAYRTPFGDNFQRGVSGTPIQNGGAFFYGGDDFLNEYLTGVTDQQWDEISTFGQSPERFNLGVNGRTRTLLDGTVVQCDPFCPSEVSDVTEVTSAAYGRLDFGLDFDGGASLAGNIGLRYVRTNVSNNSLVAFPDPARFDATTNGGNGDGVVQVSEITAACLGAGPGVPQQTFCQLNGARLAEFAALHTGELIRDQRDINFDHFLPSFNIRYDTGTGIVIRSAVSKGISRPDLNLFNAGGVLGFSGRVTDGPLLSIATGNRNLRPTEAWNYDLSAEWYFSAVGSLTAALFVKDIKGIVSSGSGLVNYTTLGGASEDVIINGPANDISGTLKGVELAYQQTYDFLPGLLSGLGSQFTYTYIDGGDFPNPNISGIGSPSVNSSGQPLNNGPFSGQLPLAGISKHTLNATLFYEKGPLSMRAAYNWRSDFLVTQRDDLFPFSPIFQEAGGQLDGSIFYSVTENIKLGVQGVNLLDETTRLSTVIDFDGTRPISAVFRNDRRYTFIARFNF